MAEASPQPGRYFCHCCSAEIAPRLPVRREREGSVVMVIPELIRLQLDVLLISWGLQFPPSPSSMAVSLVAESDGNCSFEIYGECQVAEG